MFSPSEFRDLVSGRRRGAWAALVRGGLGLAEIPYAWAVRWRNRRYATGAAPVYRLDAPVVSVGNLVLGGTGKTPMVEWLARWFAGRGVAVGVVSRGYGARAGRPNDEALELARRLPAVPHLQDPNRVRAARKAINQFHCRLLVLDDAFQHRRLGRDLDIVLLDALEPFGYGRIFPRGVLREPLEGLGRADVVVLTWADRLTVEQREEIRQRAAGLAPRALWLETAHTAQGVVDLQGACQPLDWLAGQRVVAFCGIGSPAGFRHTLTACGCQVADFREFPDHHAYGRRDLDALAASARRLDAAAVVCTEKDLVKLGSDRIGGRPLRAVRIGLEIMAGREAFEEVLAALVR